MSARNELWLALGTLLAVLVLTAFGAIGLLTRMGPAIEEILAENVVSIRAAEEMMGALALAGAGGGEEARVRFERALAVARDNVTEREEPAILTAIAEAAPGAFTGDADAVTEAVRAIEALADLNHRAVVAADERAGGLSIAGAWAAAFLGFAGFVLCLFALRHLNGSLLGPLADLDATVTAFRGGDSYRRTAIDGAVGELRRIGVAVNELLDARLRWDQPKAAGGAPAERAALVRLLDERPGLALVVDTAGGIIATSGTALEHLSGAAGEPIRMALLDLARHGADRPDWLEARPLDGAGWLCLIDPDRLRMPPQSVV